MSVRAMSWVFGLRLPPALKMIMMALADHADDAGYCWPSIPRIAAKASMSDRSVQRRLPELVARGLVVVSTRPPRQDGSQSTHGYQLLLDGGGSVSPPPARRQNDTTPVTGVSPTPVTPLSPESSSITIIGSSSMDSNPRGNEPKAAATDRQKKVQGRERPSGIISYDDEDSVKAERVEATYTSEEISTAVKSARQKLNGRGKPLQPTPGTVEAEILLARAELKKAERAKAGTGCSPPVPLTRTLDDDLKYINQMFGYGQISEAERLQQQAAAIAKWAARA
jgi:hypothetical protein